MLICALSEGEVAVTRRTKVEMAAERALVARIHESLDSDVAAVERAMVLLFRAQTDVEQATEVTTEHNAVGFSANDATVGSRIVKNVILKAADAGVPAGRRLWGASLAISRRIAKRYASTQLLASAVAKQAAVEDKARAAAAAEELDGRLVADDRGPAPGSWADVARMMAGLGGADAEGFDWDAWKDQMKEAS
jgi:hypothetical protein